MRPIHLERWAQYAGFVMEGKGRVHEYVITMLKHILRRARRSGRDAFAAPGSRD
jgi:hypothetical protein